MSRTQDARLIAVIRSSLAWDGWQTGEASETMPSTRFVVSGGGRRLLLDIAASHLAPKSLGRPLRDSLSVAAHRDHTSVSAGTGEVRMVLVYWEQLEVIVALDPGREQSACRRSRVRLRMSLLTDAYERGLAFGLGSDGCGTVAMLPGLLSHYVCAPRSIHDLAASQEIAREMNLILSDAVIQDDTIRAVARRRGTAASGTLLAVRASRFRERVLSAYGYRCAICGTRDNGITVLKIIPWTFPGTSDDTSNGLALCPNHHQAYDKALITVNTAYQVLLSEEKARSLRRDDLHSGIGEFVAALRPVIVLPAEERLRPRRDLLELGSAIRGWTG